MDIKRKMTGLLPALAGIILLLPACSKEKEGISDSDITLAKDDAYTYALYEEIDNMVMSEMATLDANSYSTAFVKSTQDETPCFTVNVDSPDSTRFPKVITMDFGEGCTVVFGDDTITRKGKIIITITDRWFMEGAQHIVTFENFSINGVQIEGTRTFSNEGINNEGHFVIGVKLENGVVTFNDSTKLTLSADYRKEWIRHFNPLADTIRVTGAANGISISGQEFSRQITEPLVLVHCSEYHLRWVIVDGMVEITNAAGTTTIDYSADGCDGTVIIGKNGYHHNYPFRYKHHRHYGRN